MIPPSNSGNVTAGRDSQTQKNMIIFKSQVIAFKIDQEIHYISQDINTLIPEKSLNIHVEGDFHQKIQEACPFKNCTTSSGAPLALELETRSWNLWIQAVEVWIPREIFGIEWKIMIGFMHIMSRAFENIYIHIYSFIYDIYIYI